MSYRKLEVWKIARELSLEIHSMTMELPKFEMFEAGSQVRRSSKSTRSNIVEGYGRRIYKGDYIKFIVYALSSNDETIDHLEVLYETKSLASEVTYNKIHDKAVMLGKKLNNFLQAIQQRHTKPFQRDNEDNPTNCDL